MLASSFTGSDWGAFRRADDGGTELRAERGSLSSPRGLMERAAKALRAHVERRHERRRARATARELDALGDRELNDIGLGRADVAALAGGKISPADLEARRRERRRSRVVVHASPRALPDEVEWPRVA